MTRHMIPGSNYRTSSWFMSSLEILNTSCSTDTGSGYSYTTIPACQSSSAVRSITTFSFEPSGRWLVWLSHKCALKLLPPFLLPSSSESLTSITCLGRCMFGCELEAWALCEWTILSSGKWQSSEARIWRKERCQQLSNEFERQVHAGGGSDGTNISPVTSLNACSFSGMVTARIGSGTQTEQILLLPS